MLESSFEKNIKSEIFYKKDVAKYQDAIKNYLNSKTKKELGLKTSVRVAGDLIEKALIPQIPKLLNDIGINFSFPKSRKRKASITFNDKRGMQYYVDIISHNVRTKFSMPNITSVDILKSLYLDNSNIFVILLIEYNPKLKENYILNVRLSPIEFYDWRCLNIGALGAGQLQIKNSSTGVLIERKGRKEWMLQFCDRLEDFYINESVKLGKRLEATKNTFREWKNRTNVWN